MVRMPSPELLDRNCPFQPVPGCIPLFARRTTAIFELWEAWEEEVECECPVPFWAVVWPGALVLARSLLEEPELVKGKEVVEIGCGGAVASISAAMAGAKKVSAIDIDPVALAIARQNADRNRVNLLLDDRRVTAGSGVGCEVILFADFFYTRTESAAVVEQMVKWRELGITILIGDGGRAFVPPDFREVLRTEWVDVDPDLEGREKRAVRILRY